VPELVTTYRVQHYWLETEYKHVPKYPQKREQASPTEQDLSQSAYVNTGKDPPCTVKTYRYHCGASDLTLRCGRMSVSWYSYRVIAMHRVIAKLVSTVLKGIQAENATVRYSDSYQ
jgi:hypothetical protein